MRLKSASSKPSSQGHDWRRRWGLPFVKGSIALLLLGWVLQQVHWRDFATSGEGSYAVLAAEPSTGAAERLLLATGPWWARSTHWRPAADFQPAQSTGAVVRPGVRSTLARVDIPLLLAAILSFFISIFVLAARWKVLLNAQAAPLPWREVIRLTFLADLGNTLLPGTVGGDLAKTYYAARQTARTTAVVVSVLMDRLLGFAGLVAQAAVMLGVVIVAARVVYPPALHAATVGVALATALMLGVGVAVASPALLRVVARSALARRLQVPRFLHELRTAVRRYAHQRRRLTASVFLTLLSQMLWIGSVALAGRSLGLTCAYGDYYLFVPLIVISTAIPLTPGGVGVVEELFVVFFAGFADASVALALALVVRLITIVCSLPGILVLLSGPRLPTLEVMETALHGHTSEASRRGCAGTHPISVAQKISREYS